MKQITMQFSKIIFNTINHSIAVIVFCFCSNGKNKNHQTTDEHGAIFPYDFTDQKEINNSLAQVYSYIKQEREKKDQEVVLLSGGDILRERLAVYYYNFEKQIHLIFTPML